MASPVMIQCAQVFIHFFSNKSRSTTKLFISEPTPAIEERLGRIFGIIEINTPSRENSKIINQVIADIEHTYYSFTETQETLESAFEKTLKHVNTTFIDIITSSTTTLVGNLNEHTMKEKINLVIGVIKNTSTIFTSLNTVGGFLLHRTNQDYKAIPIIEKTTDESTEGTSLFNTVITGEVQPDDYLLFANNDFLNFISKERFTKTITSLPPHKAADYFKNSLLQHEGFNFAAIIIKVTRRESTSPQGSRPQSLTSIDALNAHESSTERLLSASLIPNFKSVIERIKDSFTSLTRQTSTEHFETHETKDLTSKHPQQTKHVPHQNKTHNILARIKSQLNLNIPWNAFRNALKLRFNKIRLQFTKIPKSSKLLVVGLFMLGSLFTYSIIFLRHSDFQFATQETVSPELAKLSTTLDEAEAKLIASDNNAARTLLTNVEEALRSFTINTSTDQNYITSLTERFDKLIAKLRNITLIKDPTLLTTITAQTTAPFLSALVYQENTLIAFDAANNTITSLNTRTREQSIIKGSFNGRIVTANTVGERVLFVTDTNELYEIKNSVITPTPIIVPASDQIVDFTFYNNFLYALIPSTDQVYRHPQEENGYGSGITWIQESGINLENTQAIGIDTRIWIASADGTIMKFFKGRQQAFSIKNLEPALTSLTHMIKDEVSAYLYVLDSTNNRIIVLTDTGEVVTQYFSPTLSNITAFAVDEVGKALYVANSNELYAIIMSHL